MRWTGVLPLAEFVDVLLLFGITGMRVDLSLCSKRESIFHGENGGSMFLTGMLTLGIKYLLRCKFGFEATSWNVWNL